MPDPLRCYAAPPQIRRQNFVDIQSFHVIFVEAGRGSVIIVCMSHIAAAYIGGTHIRVAIYESNSTKPPTRAGRGVISRVCLYGSARKGNSGMCADEGCIFGKQDINSLPTARRALWAATKWWTADRLTTGECPFNLTESIFGGHKAC